ncbi:MAG: hypothetical protein QM723_09145 [Myxococcaceae bacterium]
MGEAKQYVFSFKEIAEQMVRAQGLTEGIWGVYFEFGLQGSNIGPNDAELVPAAILPVIRIGIQRFDKLNSLSVDASKLKTPGEKK